MEKKKKKAAAPRKPPVRSARIEGPETPFPRLRENEAAAAAARANRPGRSKPLEGSQL